VRGGMLACWVAICGLACLGVPRTARAQAEPEVSQSGPYRELIEQALGEFKHKNWPEARVLFRRAHELSPSARTQRGLGVVSYEMRDYVSAVVWLSAALVDSRQQLTDAQRKECQTLLARSRTFVGSYALTVEPADAEVKLDGAPLVRDGEGRVLVSFGEHQLRASAPGFQDSVSKLVVQGGEQSELRVALSPMALAAAASPREIPRPPPSLAASELVEPAAPPHSRRAGGLRYTWVAAGASAAFGAAALGTWFAGDGKLEQLDDRCARAASLGSPCVRGGVDTSGVQRFERATNALLGLSGAALVATAVLLALEWPRERADARAAHDTPGRDRKLALELGPQRLSLRGSF
jgi:hypothetical protein